MQKYKSLTNVSDFYIKELTLQSFRDIGIELTEQQIRKLYKDKTQTRLLYHYQSLIRK